MGTANEHSFKPGETANRAGRPRKGESLTEILKEQGDLEDVDYQGEKVARKVALAHKTWALALKGKEATIRYLYDRVDGKPVQEIKVRSDVPIDAPIIVVVAGARIEAVGEASVDELEDNDGNGDSPDDQE